MRDALRAALRLWTTVVLVWALWLQAAALALAPPGTGPHAAADAHILCLADPAANPALSLGGPGPDHEAPADHRLCCLACQIAGVAALPPPDRLALPVTAEGAGLAVFFALAPAPLGPPPRWSRPSSRAPPAFA
ncbi:hypothetical protein [Mongoliimonas terrestris]|uniref:hypothetical protein n=1 Tax=Mongoliimonas terrestris TaxID=1709001 RepID=UPI0009496531|nr:hypothetical protein [Mongoliimonas terrestris]